MMDVHGEAVPFDFMQYYYNTENEPEEKFKDDVEKYKVGIAMWACQQSAEQVDYVAVLSVDYENIDNEEVE
jgi:hypothetical protein